MYRKTVSVVVSLICMIGCDGSGGDQDVSSENSSDLCADGIDNDGDGAVDCEDAECAAFCLDTEFIPDTEDTWHNKPNRGEVVDPGVYVVSEKDIGSFEMVADGRAAPLWVSSEDFDGVIRVVGDLKTDIERVTDVSPDVMTDTPPAENNVVMVGTIGKSPLIDALVKEKKLDVEEIAGYWETFLITAVDSPAPGLKRALVIAGSDQRGTIYGVYDLSAQIGVSPWHFWADVPPAKKDALYVLKGTHSQGEPAVKYRGLFINDENPALDNWHRNYFPDEGYEFKKAFYAEVFEVMLRLKANYLWPAVWGRAFAEDDPDNHAEAKRYGIVMGTSHEAPMMRGIEEWNRGVIKDADGNPISDDYGGNGEWSYRTNKDALEAYWRDGVERMVKGDFEGVVTIGMRGPGDIALSPEDGITLVDEFIGSQRSIIEEVTGLHPAQLPQVWTLYKEVQDWWEEGLRVPGDVTVVWADDNWGNIRRLKDPKEPERPGGYGLYYHYDYVGGPRCYKWVDTNLLPNIWEQLHLAYEKGGVDRLWVVNVGDMKGNELPLQFFLDYAWNPERWPINRLPDWEEAFARQQFGDDHAGDIANLLHRYSLLQSDRKPELLNKKGPSVGCPFSLTNYREMERVTGQWLSLAEDAEALAENLSKEYRDTYYELVLYAIKASALMYEVRLAGFNNRLYADQGRASTNDMAAIAEDRFAKSRAMADFYNKELAGGKWNGFQTQPYLGYSGWQQPEENSVALSDFIYPELVTIETPLGSDMGIAVDGSDAYFPETETLPALPAFSPYQAQPSQYIEVFNRGSSPFDYDITVAPESNWLSISNASGTVDKSNNQVRAVLTIPDWTAVPAGTTDLTITVMNTTDFVSADVAAVVENPAVSPPKGVFMEANGYVSMESGHYTRIVNKSPFTWTKIPGIGRTGSGMTPFPVTADRITPGGDSARLEYDMHLFSSGTVTVYVYLSPRQNVLPTDGLTFGLSIDNGDIRSINITEKLNPTPYPEGNPAWEKGVADNVHIVLSRFDIANPGAHTLKLWAVDPAVIIQKLVVDTGGLLESYLGPKESIRL